MLFFLFSLLIIFFLLSQSQFNISNQNKSIIWVCILIGLYYVLVQSNTETQNNRPFNCKLNIPDPDPEQAHPNFKFNLAVTVYTDKNKYVAHHIYTKCLTSINQPTENNKNNCNKVNTRNLDTFSDSRADEANIQFDNNVLENTEPSEKYLNNHIQDYGYSRPILKHKGIHNSIIHILVNSGFICNIYEYDYESPYVETFLYTDVSQDDSAEDGKFKQEKKTINIPYTLDENNQKKYHIQIDPTKLMTDPYMAKLTVDTFKNMTMRDYNHKKLNFGDILNPKPGSDSDIIMRNTEDYKKYLNTIASKNSTEFKAEYKNKKNKTLYPEVPNYIKQKKTNRHMRNAYWKNTMNLQTLITPPAPYSFDTLHQRKISYWPHPTRHRYWWGRGGWHDYGYMRTYRKSHTHYHKGWYASINRSDLQTILDFHKRQLVHGFQPFVFGIDKKDKISEKMTLYGPAIVNLSDKLLYQKRSSRRSYPSEYLAKANPSHVK